MLPALAVALVPLALPQEAPTDALVGDWSGAYVRAGSALRVDVRVTRDASGELRLQERIPDWVWYGWSDPVPVTLDERDRVTFASTYGETSLFDDREYGELFGSAGRWSPEITLHLKRSLPHLDPVVEELPLSFATDVELAGTLVLPEGDGPHPCLVRIHGRGCSTRYRHRKQGHAFARYGYATLAFDQRGAGESGGDCATRTFEQLVVDAEAAYATALAHPALDPERLVLVGGSAGAWTVQAVTERLLDDPTRPVPAAIVTWIGPATSILEQQLGAGRALAADLELSPEQAALIDRQAELAVDRESPPEEVFAELDAIREQATAEGWLEEVFGDDDFPPSADELDRIWLRRHRFDPTGVLSRLTDVPYLGVFGERDSVVPLETNVSRLRALLSSAGNERFRIEVLPGLPHTLERGNLFRVFPGRAGGLSYFKFDRVEPGFFTATLDFLRSQGL